MKGVPGLRRGYKIEDRDEGNRVKEAEQRHGALEAEALRK